MWKEGVGDGKLLQSVPLKDFSEQWHTGLERE
jgi:hypothetical protein